MSKTIKALVQNNAGEVTETLNVVQGAGDKGNPARLKAVRGARYQLEDPAAANTGPDSVRTKRSAKNLHVMLEGSTEPDLIVENYYDEAVMVDETGGLYGRAEDGNLYEYIPEDPVVANLPVALADGGLPVSQVLGGGAVASTFQLAAMPLLAVGGGAALGGGGLLAAAGVLGAAALAGSASKTGARTAGLGAAPDLLDTADTGVSKTDNITGNTKPGFNVGVVPAGVTPQLVVDGVVVASQATLDADGNTILTPVAALGEGKHTLAFNYKDAQNVVSNNSPALEVTIDSLPPTAPAVATAAEMADGVINTADAANGTVIEVPLTGTGAVAGDTVTVTVDGVDTKYVLTAADVTANKASVTVPKTVLDAAGQGAATVTSFVTDVAGNKSPLSAPLALNIDTKAPTAPGAAIVNEFKNDGSVNIAEAADGIEVLVNIKVTDAVVGDVLTVYIDGLPTTYTLLAADVTAGAVKVQVPKSVVDAAGQGSATIYSTLTDASQNVSPNSPLALIKIDTIAPNKPGAPVVTENAGGGINIAEAADGTTVDVSLTGTNAVAGDKLNVIIDGTATTYTLLAADITAGKATVNVPKSVLDTAGQGAATVTATLTDAAGNTSLPSDPTQITIQSGLPSAPVAPVLPEAAGGGINTSEAVDGTTVEVGLAGTGANAGDSVNVIIDGVSTPHTLTQAEIDAGKAIVPISAAVIAGAGQGPASVTATVTVAGNTSAPSTPTVINIDTTPPVAPAAPLVAENANGGVNATEAADGIVVEVSLAGTGAVAGDIVKVMVDGVPTPYTLLQADVDAGKAMVTVPKSVLDNPAVGQGPADVKATITDIAGNTSLPSPVTTITIDTTPPVAPAAPTVAENANGGVNATEAADGIVVEVSLAGTGAVAGDIVKVMVDGVPTPYTLLQADVDAGKAMVTAPKTVLDNPAVGQGPAAITTTITDGAGNTSAPSPATTITIDTTPPVAPAAPTVAENAGGGISATEAVDGTVVEVSLTGTNALAGDVVNVIVDGVSTPYTLLTADITAGKAMVPVPAAVLTTAGQGPASVTATITDAAGNTSPPSPATNITIDTVAPNAPPTAPIVAENANGGINAAEAADGTVVEVSLTGTNAVAGDKVNVIIDGVSTSYTLLAADITAGKAMVSVPKAVLDAAGEGSASVTATITSSAGSTSVASPATTINIDTLAPTAPAAPVVAENADGGINTAEASDGTPIEVSLTGTNAVAGDVVNVIVDGVSTPYTLLPADITAGKATVTVPKTVIDAAGQGPAAVTVTITDMAGNTSSPSPATTIQIDTVAPNAPAAPVVLEDTNGGINAVEAANGTVVEVNLTGTNAVAGDKVTVTIDGTPTTYTLLPADITAGKALVTVPKSVLDSAGEGAASVTATITDIAGNTSAPSPATAINIDTTAPNAPAAPLVAENANGGINFVEAADGTVVEVSLNGTNAVAGDKVNVIIDGVSTPYTLLAADILAGKAMVTVPAAVLTAAGEGAASVTATITDAAGNTSPPSVATSITIDTSAPTAPAAPLVAEAAGGGINGVEAADGTVVEVSLTGTGALAGDVVNVIVDGVSTPYTLLAADILAGKAIVTVPAAVLTAAGQGAASVTATITDVAGNTSPSSPATTINIDTVAPNAPAAPVVAENTNGGINIVEAADGTVVEVSLAGTGAIAGDKVNVIIDGVATTYTLLAADITGGKAMVTVPKSVLDSAGQGPASVTATITDGAGATGTASPATTITIDTEAPTAAAAPVVAENANGGINAAEASDGTPVEVSLAGTGAVAGDVVNVIVDGVSTPYTLLPADITAGKATVTVPAGVLTAAGQGPAAVTATITDAAGNTSPSSPITTLNIDTLPPTAPAAPLVAENANGGINAAEALDGTPVEVSLAGTGAVAGDVVNVIIDGVSTPYTLLPADITAGKATVTVPAGVLTAAGQGPAAVTATITDSAGNTSDPSPATTINIDTLPPAAPAAPVVAENTNGGINAAEAADGTVVEVSLAGTGAVAGDVVNVIIDGVSTPYTLLPADITAGKAMVTVTEAVLTAAGQGPASVTATITDIAGNTSGPSPATTINIDTQGGGANASVTFTGLSIDVPTLTVGDSKDTGSSTTDFITNDRTLTIQGTASGFSNFGAAANDKVWVQILAPDGVTVVAEGGVVPDGSGVFTFSNQGISLPDGKYTIKTSVVDGLGNLVKAGDTQPLVIDGSGNTNPGNAPSTVDSNTGVSFSGLTIHDTAMGSTDSGSSSTDFITSDNTLVIEGNVTGFTSTGGTAGDKVRVQIFAADGTTLVAEKFVTPDSNNHFAVDNKAMSLADGKYTLKTAIVDAGGNLVKAGNTQALVIDTNDNGTNPGSNPGNPNPVDPNAGGTVTFSGLTINGLDSFDTGASSTDFITSDKTLLITGTVTGYSAAGGGIGDKVLVQIMAADGVTVVAQGFVTPDVFTGQYTFDNKGNALADGKYTIKTSIVDAAGNTVKPGDSQPLVIDTNNGGTTPGSNPGNENGQPNSSVDSNTGVTFSAFSIIDATKQSADTGSSSTDFITGDATLVFKGTAAGFTTAGGAAGDRVLVQVLAADGVTVVAEKYVTPDGSGNFMFDNTGSIIGDGNYNVKVAVVDAAGNVVKAGTTQPLVIDTSATINPGNANGVDTNTSATFSGLSINDTANGSNDDGTSTSDFITTDATLIFAGKVTGFTATGATAGDKVLVQIVNSSNVVVAQQFVAPDANGNYAFDNKTNTLADGNYTIKTSIVDAAGNTVKVGDSQPLVISASAGNTVNITGITTDSGASGTDFITNDPTLVVTGNVTGYVPASNNQVHVTVLAANGTTVIVDQFVTPNALGVWTFNNSANTLPAGNYTVRAELVSATHVSLGVVKNQALVIETAATPDANLTFSGLTIHDVPNGSTDTGTSSTDFITSDRTLMIEGKVSNFNAAHVAAGDKVLVQIVNSTNVVVAEQYVAPDASGNYTLDNRSNSLLDGDYTIKTSIVSAAGNLIKAGDTQALTIDNQAPTTPATAPASYADNVGTIQTPTSTAATTDDTTPGVNIGTVPAGTTPKLYVDGVAVAAVYDPVAGSLTPTTPLSVAPHALTYTLTDTAGMESLPSPALNVTIVGNPVFTSGATASAVENFATTATVYDAQADADTGITYTLTGADASKFAINASTGVVTFVTSPDFEAPTDAGANNVYDITVRATNTAGAFTDKAVAVTVTNVNDKPVLSFGSNVNYFENAKPAAINFGITVADQDNTTLTSAKVSITGGYVASEDVLSFTNDGSTMGNIAATQVGGVMTLTSAGGTATQAQWQAALRAVTYSNTSDIPTAAARTISYVINDGALDSSALTSTVNVIPVNDAPVPVFSNVDSHVLTTNTVPTLAITDSSATATLNNANTTFTLTFSEAIDAATLTAADITVTNGILVSLTQVDATHWTVVAKAPTAGSGVMAVSVADGVYQSLNGVDGLGGASTQAYGVGSPDTIIVGTAGADILLGSDADDTITLNGGADKVFAGAGDDVITINDGSFSALAVVGNGMKIDGGQGINTLVYDVTSGSLDLTDATVAAKLAHISSIDITGYGDNVLTLSVDNVLALSDSKIMVINQDSTIAASSGVRLVNLLSWEGAVAGSLPISGEELANTYGQNYGFDPYSGYLELKKNGVTLYINAEITLADAPTSTTTPYAGGVTKAATIDSLFGTSFTDVETALATPQTFKGVAVTFAGSADEVTTLGKYQYLNASNVWTDVAAGLTDANAIYLDRATQIRFLAATGNSAMVKPDMQVRLVDSSVAVPANGAPTDASVNGGTSAFSGQAITLTDHVVARITDNAASVAANGGAVTYTLTFSGALDPVTTFTAADFDVVHLSNTGVVSKGTVSPPTYDAVLHQWTFTVVEPATGSGTTLVSLQDGSYTSATGTSGLGATVAQTYGTAGATDLAVNSLTLSATASGVEVDTTQVATFETLQGTNTVDMTGGGINIIKLDLHAVMQMPSALDNAATTTVNESHTMVINGDGTGTLGASDELHLVDSASWTTAATTLTAASLTSAYGNDFTFTAGHQYTQYTNGAATLFVDEQMYLKNL
ncbi:Cadherin_repeat domain containing protein [Burkholderiaceae bacterium]